MIFCFSVLFDANILYNSNINYNNVNIDDTLDQEWIDQKKKGQKWKSLNDVLKVLKGSFDKCYELNNGKIVVEKTEVIQVTVQLKEGQTLVKAKFPQIGNLIQIIATVPLIAIWSVLGFPYPIMMGVACGQLISLWWFYPRIMKLKKKVEIVLTYNETNA